MKEIKHPEIEGFYVRELIEEYNKNCINPDTCSFIRNSHIRQILEGMDAFNKDIFFEMATLEARDSGLRFDIWLDEAGCQRINTHNQPRLKVKDPNDAMNFISVSISKNPEILAGKFKKNESLSDVFNFIKENYEDLMKHWNKEISTKEFLNKF